MLRKGVLLVFCFISIHVFAQKEQAGLRPEQLSVPLQQLLKNKAVYGKKERDSIDVLIAMADKSHLVPETLKARVLERYAPAGIILIRVRLSALESTLVQLNPVFASSPQKPKEELTTGSLDLSLNKINYAHSRYPLIKGERIMLSIKEQQFDTSDIDYKNRYFDSKRGAANMTAHASIMATIAAGAGNSSPFALGAAPGAVLTSSDFSSLLPDPDSVFRKYDISIQNHSYGTGVESSYGNEAFAYDVSAVNNPELLFVFSSGNSGDSLASTGTYKEIKGFSNLTGNFKYAKNILTVGATDSFNVVDARSSKGPAYDGRVKPELVAFGADGSSGAAALVSGTAALLQQAYRENNNGQLPSAALIKAILINSSDDVGSPHVDYVSGYGSLNGSKALSAVLEKRFFQLAVAHGEKKVISIDVPLHTAQLKISVAWPDVAAQPNAPKALVNDIDASLVLESTGERWLPWVLSSFPNADSLKKEAIRGLDTLNNVEQITIDRPAAGPYLLYLSGSRITNELQTVFVAYQFDTVGDFKWTFPVNDDPVIAGNNNLLRWQNSVPGRGKLEYSTDGNIWRMISNNVDLSDGYARWESPDMLQKAILRMSFDGFAPVVSDTFIISRQSEMKVGFNCGDSVLLYWSALPGIQSYKAYILGERYMQPYSLLRDTFLVVKTSQLPSSYFALAPVVDGRAGLKSYTLNYSTSGVECYFKGFFVQEKRDDYVVLRAEIGSLYNVMGVSLQKLNESQFVDMDVIENPGTLNYSFTDRSLVQGLQYYRVQIRLRNGNVVYSETVPVIHFGAAPIWVYPNPTPQNNTINVLTSAPGRYTMQVFDIQGRKVKEFKLSEGTEHIPSGQFSKGIYFIRIQSDEGKAGVQKLVIY